MKSIFSILDFNYYAWLGVSLFIGLSAVCLYFGPANTDLGLDQSDLFFKIIWSLRVPKVLTAIFAGSSLACAGAIMQTYFQNPLADPYVLGVSASSSLFVALLIMGFPVLIGPVGILAAAWIGAGVLLAILLFLHHRRSSPVAVLIGGIIFSHVAGGFISVLLSNSSSEQVRSYIAWALGSFQRVPMSSVGILGTITMAGVGASILMARPLNVLLLGEQYAQTSGVNTKRLSLLVILVTGLMAGAVTAYCGPIGFIGVVVPHMVRRLFQTTDHMTVIPMSALFGACMALLAEAVSGLLLPYPLPINAVLGLLGGPLFFYYAWVTLKRGLV